MNTTQAALYFLATVHLLFAFTVKRLLNVSDQATCIMPAAMLTFPTYFLCAVPTSRTVENKLTDGSVNSQRIFGQVWRRISGESDIRKSL